MRAHVWTHQSAIVLVRCVPGSSLLPPPYWKARDPGDEVSYLQALMYYFVYYINILMTTFLTVFRRFPKIFQNCSDCQTNVFEHFPNIFRRLPKIPDVFWRRPKKMRRCFDHSTNFSVVKGAVRETKEKWYHHIISCYDIFTAWRYHVYAPKLTWYFSGCPACPAGFSSFCDFLFTQNRGGGSVPPLDPPLIIIIIFI